MTEEKTSEEDVKWYQERYFGFLMVKDGIAFHENSFFWFWMLLPGVIAFILATQLMSGYHFDFSKAGYDCFTARFKFPLWIASGMLVTGVLCARMHGSKQRDRAIKKTEEQIQISESQVKMAEQKNKFELRFEHEREFQGYASSLGSHCTKLRRNIEDSRFLEIEVSTSPRGYLQFFPENTVGFEEAVVAEATIEALLIKAYTLFNEEAIRMVRGETDRMTLTRLGLDNISRKVPLNFYLCDFSGKRMEWDPDEWCESDNMDLVLNGVEAVLVNSSHFMSGKSDEYSFTNVINHAIQYAPNIYKLIAYKDNKNSKD